MRAGRDIAAGRDINISEDDVQDPRVQQHLKYLMDAKPEDRPAIAKRLLDIAPGLVTSILVEALPKLLK